MKLQLCGTRYILLLRLNLLQTADLSEECLLFMADPKDYANYVDGQGSDTDIQDFKTALSAVISSQAVPTSVSLLPKT